MSRSDADEEDEWDIDAELAAGLSAHRIRSAMEEALAAAIDGWKQVIRCHQPPVVATSPRPFTLNLNLQSLLLRLSLLQRTSVHLGDRVKYRQGTHARACGVLPSETRPPAHNVGSSRRNTPSSHADDPFVAWQRAKKSRARSNAASLATLCYAAPPVA